MKKNLFVLAVVGCMAALLCGCGSSHENTPKGVVEHMMQCLKDKNYSGVADIVYLDGQEDIDKDAVTFMAHSLSDQIEERGGIKHYEVEESGHVGDATVVRYLIVFGDDDEAYSSDLKVKKDSSGQWKVTRLFHL